jgi:hypothetical protein
MYGGTPRHVGSSMYPSIIVILNIFKLIYN